MCCTMINHSQALFFPSWFLHLLQLLIYPFALLLLKSPWQGAQTIIHCAVAEELQKVSGKHFVDCKMKDPPLPPSLDKEASEKLWKISTKMAGLNDDA